MDILTKAEFIATHTELYAEITNESYQKGFSEGLEKGKADGLASGAEAERNRIKGVEAALIPGHEALIGALKFDGKTTGPDAAMQVIEAENKVRESELDKLKSNTIKPAPHAAAPVVDASIENLPLEEQAKITWDKSPELRDEFKDSFAGYLAFLKNDKAGRIRILGRKE
jgi:flagellar biosynthesis/type III secretory pathway protein FliH